jgi:hypothetical protein
MSANVALRIALVTGLGLLLLAHGGAAVDRFAVGLFAFGLLNVFLTPPGTGWLRAAAIVAAATGLAWEASRTLVMILIWLIWPPAFMVAWAISRRSDVTAGERSIAGPAAGRSARVTVAAVIAAVACASAAYRLIFSHGLQQTAALFIGLPALLAIVVVLAVSPRSAVGVACKAVTVGLLVSLLFLGEGILCILMSAPIFYGVAVLIGLAVGRRDRFDSPAHTTLTCIVLLAFVPMSLEGVTSRTSFNRDEWVTESGIVHASADVVERAIVQPPRFDRPLPLYLRAGFPRPTSTRIQSEDGSRRWVVRFRGGEMRIDGIEPRAGDLVLELQEARTGLVRWRAIGDGSHMTHFLAWREASVQWEAIDAHSTRVTWTLSYRRGLDPAWYFGPWERYAVRLAARYLIDAVATP